MNNIVKSFNRLCEVENEENEAIFFEAVKNGVFWVPVRFVRKDGGSMDIFFIQSSKGRVYIPAYLTRESGRKRHCGASFIKMTYEKMKSMIHAGACSQRVSGMVIEPFGDKIVVDSFLMHIIDVKTGDITDSKVKPIGEKEGESSKYACQRI